MSFLHILFSRLARVLQISVKSDSFTNVKHVVCSVQLLEHCDGVALDHLKKAVQNVQDEGYEFDLKYVCQRMQWTHPLWSVNGKPAQVSKRPQSILLYQAYIVLCMQRKEMFCEFEVCSVRTSSAASNQGEIIIGAVIVIQ